MYRKKPETRLFVFPAIVLLLLGAGLSLIQVPYSISGYAEIFPKSKWLLTRGSNGEILSNYIDYTTGRLNTYSIANFERGEYISLQFSKFLSAKKFVHLGDTVAIINSSNLQDQMLAALSQLEVATAQLQADNSPAKSALIAEAELKVQVNQKKVDEQKIIFDRTFQLFQKGYSSQQEYDLQKNTLDLLHLELKINEAAVTNLKTGVKPEEITLLETQIIAARKRIEYLNDREDEYIITSPIPGRIIPSFSPDTLLYVSDFSELVLHIPFALPDAEAVNEQEKIIINLPGYDISISGLVLNKGTEVKMIDRRQAIFISVLINAADKRLLPGMVLPCSVTSQSVSVLSYLFEHANH